MWRREGQQWGPLLLFLPGGLQTYWDVPALLRIRTGALNRDQCCPRPASPQQLGFHHGIQHIMRISRAGPLCRRLSPLLRSEETGKKPLGQF